MTDKPDDLRQLVELGRRFAEKAGAARSGDEAESALALHREMLGRVQAMFPGMTFDAEPMDADLSTERVPVEIEGTDVDMAYRLELKRLPTAEERAAIDAAVEAWAHEHAKYVDGPTPVRDDQTLECVVDIAGSGRDVHRDLIGRLDAALAPHPLTVRRLLLTTEPVESDLEP